MPKSFWDIKGKIESLEGISDWVQIDICDGRFVPNQTWSNTGDLEEIVGKIKFEIHLMVEKPEEVAGDWLGVADRLIVHVESTDQLGGILNAFSPHHNEVGVALLLETPIEALDPYWEQIKTVQLMSIAKVGHQGEPFDPRVIDRIKRIKQEHPGIRVQVDGGINEETISLVSSAGADAVAAVA